ncbi:MAG TPA: ArsC family reductase [Chitinophagaceae bacterium]|nr:ArsC family reductase [Chitinophagaceae bacterium]
MYIVYGIPNCNSVQKARAWLDNKGISYQFHDYKKSGITRSKLTSWSKQLGWENLINKNGTTWRGLEETRKESITTQAAGIALMMEEHSVIKRPVIEKDDKIVAIRFNETEYEKAFL